MSATIYISATLRGFVEGNNELSTEAKSVGKALEELKDEYIELKKVLFDEDERLRPFIKVYKNGEDVTDILVSGLKDGDEIILLPSIAGGSGRKKTEVSESDTELQKSLISDERRKEISLDDAEIDRYGRHLMLKEIGVKGQKRIRASRVLVIGLGALGSPVIQYLAAAGVGTIGIADFDKVSVENLQNQVIHSTRDVKRPKTASAKDTIRAINPKVNVEVIDKEIEPDNILDIIDEYDVVADCTDNYKSRYLINDACVILGKPDVYAAIYKYEAQVGIYTGETGCLRCQYPSPPPPGLIPTCSEGGTLSPLGGIAGSIQAAEILKLIIGDAQTLKGRLLHIDIWNVRGEVLKIRKKSDCPVCGGHAHLLDVEEYDYDELCGTGIQETEIPIESLEAEELIERIERGDDITIVDVREPHERAIHRFPHAIVIPIGQLARRKNELDPNKDTIFICREGKRSILAINTLREAGYEGPLYNLKGGIEATKHIIFSNEGAWL